MLRTCTIHTVPADHCINPELALALINQVIPLRTEMFEWTIDPATGADALVYFLHNDDIRAVLTVSLGISRASCYHPYLPIGRTTRVPKTCCKIQHTTTPIHQAIQGD